MADNNLHAQGQNHICCGQVVVGAFSLDGQANRAVIPNSLVRGKMVPGNPLQSTKTVSVEVVDAKKISLGCHPGKTVGKTVDKTVDTTMTRLYLGGCDVARTGGQKGILMFCLSSFWLQNISNKN